MKTKQFKLSHVVLYAKGWYLETENKWEDLKKILTLDGYTPFTNSDVYSIIINAFDNFEYRATELKQMLSGIHPEECWKYGYYTNTCTWINDYDNLPFYKMEDAIIHYILSTLRTLDKEHWIKVIPKYKKYPKPQNLSLKKVIDIFNDKKL